MMNALKTVFYLSIRGYRKGQQTRRRREFVPKLDESKLHYPEIGDPEYGDDIDCDDPDRFEADFTGVHKTYDEHQRETMIHREKVKLRIIRRKYFKLDDPNFLTWSEKEQIRSLHENDQIEWTPERLSECFPALPETINLVLKAKWKPKDVNTIIKYDQKVIENWKTFKSGGFALNPELMEHLNKFKNRKIDIEDLKKIADQFIPPPPVFPKPKSQVFSSMVQRVIESGKSPEKITDGNTKKITDGKNQVKRSDTVEKIIPEYNINPNQHVTFDSFLDNAVNNIAKNNESSLESRLIVEEYKKRKNIQTLDQLSTKNSSNEKLIETTSSNISENSSNEIIKRNPIDAQVPQQFDRDFIEVKVPDLKIEAGSMRTGILEWKKKQVCGEEDYPNFIKIPRAKAKTNITFRVNDRYYDADGEFLYRVPGLRS